MKTFAVVTLLALAPMTAPTILWAASPGQPHGGRTDMFTKWDTNGDGVVTKEEAQAASAQEVAKRFDELDLNKDGQITREEMAQAREAHRTAMKEKFQAEFKAADKNGDGALSRDEAAALPRIAQHFDQLDTNKDGVVTQEELQAHHQHWRGNHQPPPSQG